MYKNIFLALISITIFSCNSNQKGANSTTDEGMADYNINSKLVLDGFEAFTKDDSITFNINFSDTVKVHGASYGQEAVVDKKTLLQRLQGMHKIMSNIKANDIKLLPGVDEVTFKPDGGVRAYVRWTDDAIANGVKIEHKFYGVYQFNKDHKVVDVDEYMDITGVIKAATEKK